MSTISVIVDQEAVAARVLVRIQELTGRSLVELRRSISSRRPVFEREIFDESYGDHATLVRQLLQILVENSVAIRIYELPEGETTDSFGSLDTRRISVGVLLKLLDEADAELRRQLNDKSES